MADYIDYVVDQKDPVKAMQDIMLQVRSHEVGVANTFNVIAKGLEKIPPENTVFFNETKKLIIERVAKRENIHYENNIGQEKEINSQLLDHLNFFARGKRLDRDLDIVNKILYNDFIKDEDRPQLMINFLKDRQGDGYGKAKELVAESLLNDNSNRELSSFTIKQISRAEHMGLDHYKVNRFEAITANISNDFGEVAHEIFNAAYGETNPNKEKTVKTFLTHLDIVAGMRPDILDDVREQLLFTLDVGKQQFSHEMKIEIKNRIKEHKLYFEKFELEGETHSILDDLRLSSQEKVQKIQDELKKSVKRGTYAVDVQTVMNTTHENFNQDVAMFALQQIKKMDAIGINNYKAEGMDFINFNKDPEEAANFVLSKGIEKKDTTPVFTSMKEELEQIKDPSFLKDTLTSLKYKVATFLKSNPILEGVSEKIENYSVEKGLTVAKELVGNFSKNLVNFVNKMNEEKDNKKENKNNFSPKM